MSESPDSPGEYFDETQKVAMQRLGMQKMHEEYARKLEAAAHVRVTLEKDNEELRKDCKFYMKQNVALRSCMRKLLKL